MATYTFTLVIDSLILNNRSSDSFCIAKKVGDSFTTVFQDGAIAPKTAEQKTLVSTNVFQWQDKYQVFLAAEYKHGVLVQSVTNHVPVAFGEATEYKNNKLSDALSAQASDFENGSGSESHEDSFLANMIPNQLHTAVETFSGGKWVCIYVDPDSHVGDVNKQLTPKNEYMLFWANRVETDSMIDATKFAHPFYFSFEAGSKDKTVRFGYNTPDKPAGGETPVFHNA